MALRIRRADDVDAADVRINPVGHIHPHHLGTELRIALDLLTRNDTGFEDLLLVVDVVDEAVERRDALHQAGLHAFPLVRRDDARNQVKRDQALGARAVLVFFAINGEGDAHVAKDDLRLFATGLHDTRILRGQPAGIGFVVLANFTRFTFFGQPGIHLIESAHTELSCNKLSKLHTCST